MKRFLLFLLVFLLFGAQDSFAENVTDGTGAGAAITTADDNVAIGSYSLQSITTPFGNTAVGAYAGRSALTVNGGLYLGYGAGIDNTSAHKLYMNTMFYPTNGIFGDFSTGYFGINNTSPAVALDITGSMALSGTLTYALGTAALPSIIFAGDTDTGLFGLASYGNRIGLSAKGATVAVADTAGVMAIPGISVRLSQYSNTADSALTVSLTSGVPAVNFYGTDTDTYSISINTSDQALFSGASGGYDFDTYVGADSLVIRPGAAAANTLFRGKSSDGTNVATIDTVGAMQIGRPYNGNISFIAVNNDSTNTAATANVKAFANWGGTSILAHGKGRTDVRYGHQIGNWGTVEMDATSTYTGANGLIIGTRCAKPMIFGINDSFAAVIDSTERVGIGTELPTAKLTVRSIVGDNDSLLVLRSSLGKTVAFIDSLGKSVSVIAKSDTVQTTNFAATGYGIINGASIMRGGLALTGSTPKTINFAGMTPDLTDADNALLAFGTWNDEVDIGTQTAHFVPYQVHMHSTTSAPYDIAAMRLRVDTDGANNQNAVQVLQIRSSISDSVASAGAFGAGMSIDAPMAVMTGEMVVGGFSMAGAYKPTSATNPVTILQACNWNTYAGTSVTQIADFYQNGAGNTVDDILRLNVIAGTATDGLHVSNTSGTMTNGIKLTGTIGTDITLQNAETIKNTKNGIVEIGGALGYTYNVQAIVADSTLTSAVMPSGSIITNGAATVTIEVTLPTAVTGLIYRFVTTDTDSLIVVAGASDTITDSAAASLADYAAVGTVGETVELVAISDAVWQVMYKTGTWAAR